MTHPDGIHLTLPLADYLALDRYGSSDLRAMRKGPPSLVPWQRANPRADTDATRFGTACHCAILEATSFESRYVIKPEDAPDRPTQAMLTAKKRSESSEARVSWWADFSARSNGKTVLSADEMWRVCGVKNAFMEKVAAASSIHGAVREATLLWTDKATGLKLKARPDWYDDDAIYDLKVSRNAEEHRLAFRAYADGWYHQLAFYLMGARALGLSAQRGRLAVIHPEPPHAIYLKEVKRDALDLLALEHERTIAAMAECHRTGRWPGTPEEWVRVDLPPSALAEIAGAADFATEEV